MVLKISNAAKRFSLIFGEVHVWILKQLPTDIWHKHYFVVHTVKYFVLAQKETTTWDFEVYYEVIGRLRLKHRSRPARNADFSALFLACFFLIIFMHLVSS